MQYDSRISGAGGSDLFGAGTYKISDKTLNLDGTPRKIHSLITHSGCDITGLKYTDAEGNEKTSALKIVSAGVLENGTLVTFQTPVHEITINAGSAIFYFV